MAPIPDFPYAEVRSQVTGLVHAGHSRFQADVYALPWQRRPALLKDFSRRPWWVRWTVGRFVLGREFRALRRLDGQIGVPRLLGTAGPHAMLMERLAARRMPRNRERPPSAEFFDRLRRLIDALHARGIGHGDLRRMNILMDEAEQPYLIDFATSVTAKPGLSGWLTRWVFRRFAAVDRVTFARIKSEFYPDRLSPEERRWLTHPPLDLRLGRFLKKKVYNLRKARRRRKLMKRLRRSIRRRLSAWGRGPSPGRNPRSSDEG